MMVLWCVKKQLTHIPQSSDHPHQWVSLFLLAIQSIIHYSTALVSSLFRITFNKIRFSILTKLCPVIFNHFQKCKFSRQPQPILILSRLCPTILNHSRIWHRKIPRQPLPSMIIPKSYPSRLNHFQKFYTLPNLHKASKQLMEIIWWLSSIYLYWKQHAWFFFRYLIQRQRWVLNSLVKKGASNPNWEAIHSRTKFYWSRKITRDHPRFKTTK